MRSVMPLVVRTAAVTQRRAFRANADDAPAEASSARPSGTKKTIMPKTTLKFPLGPPPSPPLDVRAPRDPDIGAGVVVGASVGRGDGSRGKPASQAVDGSRPSPSQWGTAPSATQASPTKTVWNAARALLPVAKKAATKYMPASSKSTAPTTVWLRFEGREASRSSK